MNEYFVELNAANFKVLNQFLNWICRKKWYWIFFWIEFCRKILIEFFVELNFGRKIKMNRILNQSFEFIIFQKKSSFNWGNLHTFVVNPSSTPIMKLYFSTHRHLYRAPRLQLINITPQLQNKKIQDMTFVICSDSTIINDSIELLNWIIYWIESLEFILELNNSLNWIFGDQYWIEHWIESIIGKIQTLNWIR